MITLLSLLSLLIRGLIYHVTFLVCLAALQSDTQAKELLDVDASSVILENGMTKLNTIGHYEVRTKILRLLFLRKISPVEAILDRNKLGFSMHG